MTTRSLSEVKYNGAMLTGFASRSPATVQVHRAVRDGHAKEADFANALEKDAQQLIAQQKNFTFVSGGQLNWLDILRPIALSFNGFQKRGENKEDAVGPVTRWYRTNTFYRKPLVSGEIEGNRESLAQWLLTVNNGVAFFLGPYSFCKLVENSFYENNNELAMDYANAIANSIPALKQKGYNCVLFLEPSVGYDISLNLFNSLWPKGIFSQFKEIKLGVHFSQADATRVLPLVEQHNVDFIGIDCIYTQNPEQIQTSKDLLLGIIDGSRASVETINAIKLLAKKFLEQANFSGNFYIGPNDRLFDVPFESALKKIKLLAQFSLAD